MSKRLLLLAGLLALSTPTLPAESAPQPSRADSTHVVTAPQITWHWHMHQPIYWNTRQETGVDRYEYAWESIVAKDAGRPNPENNLREIFGNDDRVAAYQWGPRNSINSIRSTPNGGASVSYTGALMENVNSIAQANQLGYDPNWRSHWIEAHGWQTTGGHPRMDLVTMSFHHALLPLHNDETIRMELLLMQEKIRREFGEAVVSRGFFPTEMAFSTRLIPILNELGIEWSIVSGEKIARAIPNFPVVLGSGGIVNDIPNRSDMRNPPVDSPYQWVRRSISRGNSPVNANPMSYQPAYTRFVHPETGEEHFIIVIPSDQAIGWEDGSQCISPDFLDILTLFNDPNQPSLVHMAHDGDNFFGGGFSYYNECVPNLASATVSRGNDVTTVEQYLASFPPDPNRIIHVEDGAWVNADPDFGSPTFIRWLYPPLDQQGNIDPENGWHETIRDYAIFTATLNRLLTAQQFAEDSEDYEIDLGEILYPSNSTHPVDRAWHYHLGSLDSGNVYYGANLDFPIKATIGANDAHRLVDPILASGGEDRTPPTIWTPQRHPYNPGGRNFGVQYGYREYFDDGDFHVYTVIHDASGPAGATLYYRVMDEPELRNDQIAPYTYAGGEGVGEWIGVPMTRREFPKDNIFNRPGFDFFVLPDHIADYHWAEIQGLRDVMVNYYVEAIDLHGNIARSPIQHVYVGDGEGATDPGGPDGRVDIDPSPLERGRAATLTYTPTGGPLADAEQIFIHRGKNGWQNVVQPNPPMASNGEGAWEYTFTVDADASEINVVFNDGAGNWDNNNGADWRFVTIDPDGVAPPEVPPIPGRVRITPDPSVAGASVLVEYDPRGGPLASASSISIRKGYDTFGVVESPDLALSFNETTGYWQVTYTVAPSALNNISFAFHDGAEANWDNNSGNDWLFPVLPQGTIVIPSNLFLITGPNTPE